MIGSLLIVTGPPGAGKSTVARLLADRATPSVLVEGVATRVGHGFSGEAATRKMHDEFSRADVEARHVLRDPPGAAAEVADRVEEARRAGSLGYRLPG